MSATFKNAKKKAMQTELRKFMHDHKEKTQKRSAQKIESPLAKYNDAGQLTCILCQSVVRSEAIWTIHVNAKQHRQNVENAKRLKEKTNNFTTAIKRTASPPPESTKRVKGILKNSGSVQKIAAPSNIVVVEEKMEVGKVEVAVKEKAELPADFFDGKKEAEQGDEDEALPEGFFDDPKLDAKARNIEYRDPIEEEWEKFQREIKVADHESAAIVAEDQEEATVERQLDEIDEQMKNWSRVVNLERKKVEVIAAVNEQHTPMDEDSSSDIDDDVDEFLDWRAKKSYK